MIRILSIVLCMTAASASAQQLEAAAADINSASELKVAEVAEIDTITRRGAAGRIETFMDSRHRSYSVVYDSSSRVASIRKRSDRVYIDDLLNVSYADDGRLVSVLFGDGNLWVFSYGDDGTQFVQDRYGAVVSSRFSEVGNRFIFAKADPKGRLSNNLEKLDALLAELNGSR